MLQYALPGVAIAGSSTTWSGFFDTSCSKDESAYETLEAAVVASAWRIAKALCRNGESGLMIKIRYMAVRPTASLSAELEDVYVAGSLTKEVGGRMDCTQTPCRERLLFILDSRANVLVGAAPVLAAPLGGMARCNITQALKCRTTVPNAWRETGDW